MIAFWLFLKPLLVAAAKAIVAAVVAKVTEVIIDKVRTVQYA